MSDVARVALNIDLGELADEPPELYRLATVANIACGGHAGDPISMRRACSLALEHGAMIAAHPSYPDREHFGRRRMEMAAADLRDAIADQCGALRRIADEVGVTVAIVKPHGALYHACSDDTVVTSAVLEGVERVIDDFVFVGSPDLHARVAGRGHEFHAEGFADRGYRADGRLIPRGEPGALLTDPAAAAAQARRLAESGQFRTLCVHGDGPEALPIARAVRECLEASGLLA